MAKGKKGKKSDEGGEVVAETADQAEWKSLKAEADRLHKITKREEHDFHEFQQQREKVNYFWIVEKKKVEDKRVELRNKDRELQDLQEKHQVEIKIYKQRLKHLLYEHQNEITHKKTETEKALKMAQDDDREGEYFISQQRPWNSVCAPLLSLTCMDSLSHLSHLPLPPLFLTLPPHNQARATSRRTGAR